MEKELIDKTTEPQHYEFKISDVQEECSCGSKNIIVKKWPFICCDDDEQTPDILVDAFTASCAVCHRSPGHAAGLDVKEATEIWNTARAAQIKNATK